jgi:hypothetical protein
MNKSDIVKKISRLKIEKNEIINKINENYHYLFADYLNNELKMIDYKDNFYAIDNGKYGYFNLPWTMCENIKKWFHYNNIELYEYNFKGVIIEINTCGYSSGRILFENEVIKLNFIKTYTVKY